MGGCRDDDKDRGSTQILYFHSLLPNQKRQKPPRSGRERGASAAPGRFARARHR